MKQLCKNKHWQLNKDYNLDKILYLLIDKPTSIDYCNRFFWQNKEKQFNREYDLPAFIDNDGYIVWYRNNKLHRNKNKPTVIWSNGEKEYWHLGKEKQQICYNFYINGKINKIK